MQQGAGSRGLEAARFLRWVALCFVVLGGCEPRRESDVASVNGVAIPQHEVRMELRAMLWRRGETWDALDEAVRVKRRQEALDRCIEARLLADFSKPPASLPPELAAEAEREFQQFLKQFEPPEGWKPRFEMQGLSEVQARDRITAEVVQTDAIEAWLMRQGEGTREKGEEAALTWFEQHRESLRLPERARVSHVFLTTHDVNKPDRSAEIAELHRKLVAGEITLVALAARHSEDERSKKTGGSLGWITRDRVPADFAEKVFTLPLHQPSAPFRTAMGWHIAVVHERQAARLPEFAEVKAEILARLDHTWRETAVKRLVEELRNKSQIVSDRAVLEHVQPAP